MTQSFSADNHGCREFSIGDFRFSIDDCRHMSSPELDVRYVANLARIALTDEEVATFQGQLSRILDHVTQLEKVDVSGVEPMAHANPVFNVFRADEPRTSLPKADALANAPRQANGLFVVTKVVE